MTDGKFLALIRKVSLNDTYYFTLNQFYAHYCRSQRKGYRVLLVIGLSLLTLTVVLAFLNEDFIVFAIMLGVAALACLWKAATRAFGRLPSLSSFRAVIDKWYGAGRSIDKLLTQPSLDTPPPEWEEPDIYDYGVERLLIVEHNLLVDLFVRNGFHAQERALVVSEQGYPSYLLPVAIRCLQDNPELPVYLLHDATRRGAMMAQRVTNSNLLTLEGHPVLDLGIFPEDVKRMPNQKALRPHKQNHAIPVDFILFSTLGMGVAQAMAENLVFGDLLQASQTEAAGGRFVADFG